MGLGKGCSKFGGETIAQSRDRKRKDAVSRQAAYDSLTVAEKISRLPIDGAKRQRKRFAV